MKRKSIYEFRAYKPNPNVTDKIYKHSSTRKGILRKLANLPKEYVSNGVYVVRYFVKNGKCVKDTGC